MLFEFLDVADYGHKWSQNLMLSPFPNVEVACAMSYTLTIDYGNI